MVGLSSTGLTHPLDIKLAKLLPASSSRQEESKQRVFDVTMAPILAFYLGGRADVTSSEGVCWVSKENDKTETC